MDRDRWEAALNAVDVQPDGLTAHELAAQFNRSLDWVRRHLRTLTAKGIIEYSGRRSITTIDGRHAKVPVYRLVRRGRFPNKNHSPTNKDK